MSSLTALASALALTDADITASDSRPGVPLQDVPMDDAPLKEMERALAELELEMFDLQHRHRDVFSYANAWAERHDALVRNTPAPLRDLVGQRLHRIGVRWGVASGVRMTAQFPAIRFPV